MDFSDVTWRKSSYSGASGGSCVEVGVWRKSSYSGSSGGGCVEVAQFPASAVAVRDSKNPDGPKLVLASADWRSFLSGMKAGTFDLS
jgi:hypothetical protein